MAGGHSPAPWEQPGAERSPQPVHQPPPASYQPSRTRGPSYTRHIIGGVILFMLVVGGPAIFAIMRAVGEERREDDRQRKELQAEEQKQEAIALCERAEQYMLNEYAQSHDSLAVITDMNAQIEAGYYTSAHFKLGHASYMSDDRSNIPGLMHVGIECAANGSAANPYARCTYAFNWKTGASQVSWK